MIKNVLISELDGKKVDAEGRWHHWTYYSFRVYWGVKDYRLVWCVADNEPRALGIMDCYQQDRFDKKDD